jgi:hypothetical protein
LLELPDGYFAAFWAAGIEISHATSVAEGRYRDACAFWSTDREKVLHYMEHGADESEQFWDGEDDSQARANSKRATMPEKLTIEVPAELQDQFAKLSHYVDDVKGHAQTRRLLLDMASEGVAAHLAHQEAFYSGYPSIVVNGKPLSRGQAAAVWAAITRYGDALKDGEMGPIDEVRSIIGR